MHICIHLLSAFVGSVGGRPGRSTQTFVLGLCSVNSITTERKNVKAKNQQEVRLQPSRQPEHTQGPGSSFILLSPQESIFKRCKGLTRTFHLDCSLLVIAACCQAAVWTTVNCQLSGLAHCKRIIMAHCSCFI